MKLLMQSAMIFFGTLMAAAVVAFGEPAKADVDTAAGVVPQATVTALHRDLSSRHAHPWIAMASAKVGERLH